MEFTDSFMIPAPPDRVWTAMFDPDVMRRVLPGCRRLESTGDHEFAVTLAAGIGVLRGVFGGEVRFRDLEEPISCGLDIAVQGSLGRVRGSGSVSLRREDGGTRLDYATTFFFAGPMAGIGEGLMRSVATALTNDAMRHFRDLVAAASMTGSTAQ